VTIFTNMRTINLLLLIFLFTFLVGVSFYHRDYLVNSFRGKPPAEEAVDGKISKEKKDSSGNKPGEESNSRAVTADESLESFSPGEILKNKAEGIKKADGREFFVEYRMERERVRGQQIELLQKIVDDPDSDPEMRKEAQKRLIELTENMEKELQLESLIKAKGYEEAALFIQPDSATVIIKKEEIKEEDATKIADIVSKVTGYGLSNIVVIPK